MFQAMLVFKTELMVNISRPIVIKSIHGEFARVQQGHSSSATQWYELPDLDLEDRQLKFKLKDQVIHTIFFRLRRIDANRS